MPKRQLDATLNKLADIIREAKTISFADLCLRGNIAPSTLWSYRKLLEARFEDITYEEGEFKVREV